MGIEIILAIGLVNILIALMIGYYSYHDKERLTGRYVIRKYVGFKNDEVIVEYKHNHELKTRSATDEDIKVLKKKFKHNLNKEF